MSTPRDIQGAPPRLSGSEWLECVEPTGRPHVWTAGSAALQRAHEHDMACGLGRRAANYLWTEKHLPENSVHGVLNARRARLVENAADATADVLDRLAGDPDPAIRAAAARQPGCAVGTLRRLATDPDRHVRRTAAANPSAPDDVRSFSALAGSATELTSR